MQSLIEHSDITINIYTQVIQEIKNKAIDKINDIFTLEYITLKPIYLASFLPKLYPNYTPTTYISV